MEDKLLRQVRSLKQLLQKGDFDGASNIMDKNLEVNLDFNKRRRTPLIKELLPNFKKLINKNENILLNDEVINKLKGINEFIPTDKWNIKSYIQSISKETISSIIIGKVLKDNFNQNLKDNMCMIIKYWKHEKTLTNDSFFTIKPNYLNNDQLVYIHNQPEIRESKKYKTDILYFTNQIIWIDRNVVNLQNLEISVVE